MRKLVACLMTYCLLAGFSSACAQTPAAVADVATRPGGIQPLPVHSPAQSEATLVLFAGGDGSLQLRPENALARLDTFFEDPQP
jgi:hypothetical protein